MAQRVAVTLGGLLSSVNQNKMQSLVKHSRTLSQAEMHHSSVLRDVLLIGRAGALEMLPVNLSML